MSSADNMASDCKEKNSDHDEILKINKYATLWIFNSY
jgi:hypothetical protein